MQLAGLAVVDGEAGESAGDPAGEPVTVAEPVPGEGLVPPAAPAAGMRGPGLWPAAFCSGRLEPGGRGAGMMPGAGGCSMAAGTAGDGLTPGAGDAPDGHRLQVAAQ